MRLVPACRADQACRNGKFLVATEQIKTMQSFKSRIRERRVTLEIMPASGLIGPPASNEANMR
jgi:hypothetical protein